MKSADKIRFFIANHSVLYFALFKFIFPFIMSILQLDYLCSVFVTYLLDVNPGIVNNLTFTIIIYLAFLTFLLLLPRFASFLEFVFHPFFLIAIFKYGFSNTFLIIVAVIFTVVLLTAKILFYFNILRYDNKNTPDDYEHAQA